LAAEARQGAAGARPDRGGHRQLQRGPSGRGGVAGAGRASRRPAPAVAPPPQPAPPGPDGMMARAMGDRFDEIEERYEGLTRQLSEPDVASDPGRLKELGKQAAELQEIVRVHRARREALRQAEEWRLLAKEESDPATARSFRDEADAAERHAQELAEQLELLLIPKDPNDERGVIMEIRAGTGGQEAALFAGELYEMYQRYADGHRWTFEVLSSSPSELGGFKE